MRRFHNPRYAPESLERKLNPSNVVPVPVAEVQAAVTQTAGPTMPVSYTQDANASDSTSASVPGDSTTPVPSTPGSPEPTDPATPPGGTDPAPPPGDGTIPYDPPSIPGGPADPQS